jgi:hypothetical protein
MDGPTTEYVLYGSQDMLVLLQSADEAARGLEAFLRKNAIAFSFMVGEQTYIHEGITAAAAPLDEVDSAEVERILEMHGQEVLLEPLFHELVNKNILLGVTMSHDDPKTVIPNHAFIAVYWRNFQQTDAVDLLGAFRANPIAGGMLRGFTLCQGGVGCVIEVSTLDPANLQFLGQLIRDGAKTAGGCETQTDLVADCLTWQPPRYRAVPPSSAFSTSSLVVTDAVAREVSAFLNECSAGAAERYMGLKAAERVALVDTILELGGPAASQWLPAEIQSGIGKACVRLADGFLRSNAGDMRAAMIDVGILLEAYVAEVAQEVVLACYRTLDEGYAALRLDQSILNMTDGLSKWAKILKRTREGEIHKAVGLHPADLGDEWLNALRAARNCAAHKNLHPQRWEGNRLEVLRDARVYIRHAALCMADMQSRMRFWAPFDNEGRDTPIALADYLAHVTPRPPRYELLHKSGALGTEPRAAAVKSGLKQLNTLVASGKASGVRETLLQLLQTITRGRHREMPEALAAGAKLLREQPEVAPHALADWLGWYICVAPSAKQDAAIRALMRPPAKEKPRAAEAAVLDSDPVS